MTRQIKQFLKTPFCVVIYFLQVSDQLTCFFRAASFFMVAASYSTMAGNLSFYLLEIVCVNI